ncbi:molybdopterin-dependent oxidoreductase [Streptomyces sp. NPDC127074]|uniref:molybdopterin-dependent oxidoreductase n=1 Tax=Streptomyces sp. NPDC127074 TaxID=3347130 RepID=UPI00364C3D7E
MRELKPGYCTMCRSRCGSLNTVENGKLVAVEPLPSHPTGGALCSKGRAAPEITDSVRRLTKPLRRTRPKGEADPGWVEVSWDEALEDIAQRLLRIKAESGAESVAFAATTPSGTPIVDSIEWVERLVRTFGSPNLIYAVENCGWHKDYVHELTFGDGIGSPDYDGADLIVLWGHNPARTWLAQATRIADARRRGARVVVIDPKRKGSGQQADLWLGIRPGSDAALALGAIRHLISERSFDEEFVRSWTNAPFLVDRATGRFVKGSEIPGAGSPDDFVVWDESTAGPRVHDPDRALEGPAAVALTGTHAFTDVSGHRRVARPALALLAEECEIWTADRVARTTWLSEPDVQEFYHLLSAHRRISYYSWTGVGQHSNATQTERAIAVMYALTGACDRPGGNFWPVPPQTNALNDIGLLDAGQRSKALGLDDLPLGPPRLGWTTARHFCRAVLEGDPYKVRALVGFGSNFVVTQGNSRRNAKALEALDLHVHVDLFLNPTAMSADYVLPANSPWEHEALKIGFEITQEAVEHIQLRQRMIEPVGESRPDYAIAADLACRLGLSELFFDGDIEAGWNHQLAPTGLTVQRLRQSPEGIRVPQELHFEKYARPSLSGGVNGFRTQTKRVEIYSETLLRHGYEPLPTFTDPSGDLTGTPPDGTYPLIMSTCKSGNYVHSSHRHLTSLRRRALQPTVDVHPDLAADRGLEEGEWAMVATPAGAARMQVRLDADLHPRVVLAEFGWWEDCPPLALAATPVFGTGTSNINAALDDTAHDPTSGSVPLRAVRCELRKAAESSQGRWSGRRRFTVRELRRPTPDVLGILMSPSDGQEVPRVPPGQHVLFETERKEVARAYSVTSVDHTHRVIGIAVKRIPGGAVSDDLHHHLETGDTVWLRPPSGSFTPPLTTNRPVVLVAGGIGITPFLHYARALEHSPSRPPRVVLMNGCSNGGDNAFGDELATIGTLVPELEVLTWYANPEPADKSPQEYQHTGYVDPGVLDDALLARRPLFYLCGPDPMMKAVTAALTERGVPRFDILTEVFQAAAEVPKTLEPRTVHLTESDQSFTWRPELGTLLDAADRNGISLPSGCRVGQCESCALSVVGGSVAHLSEREGDAESCLTCQAVPLSDLSLRA